MVWRLNFQYLIPGVYKLLVSFINKRALDTDEESLDFDEDFALVLDAEEPDELLDFLRFFPLLLRLFLPLPDFFLDLPRDLDFSLRLERSASLSTAAKIVDVTVSSTSSSSSASQTRNCLHSLGWNWKDHWQSNYSTHSSWILELPTDAFFQFFFWVSCCVMFLWNLTL